MIGYHVKTLSPKIILCVSLSILVVLGCASKSSQHKTTEVAAETPAEAIEPEKEIAKVKKIAGINGFEGDILGAPVVGSKFQSLQIGMTVKQVTDILGRPSWRGTYGTPFSGGDRTAFQLRYRDQGDLVFTGGKLFDNAPGNLVIIRHNAKEYAFGSR